MLTSLHSLLDETEKVYSMYLKKCTLCNLLDETKTCSMFSTACTLKNAYIIVHLTGRDKEKQLAHLKKKLLPFVRRQRELTPYAKIFRIQHVPEKKCKFFVQHTVMLVRHLTMSPSARASSGISAECDSLAKPTPLSGGTVTTCLTFTTITAVESREEEEDEEEEEEEEEEEDGSSARSYARISSWNTDKDN